MQEKKSVTKDDEGVTLQTLSDQIKQVIAALGKNAAPAKTDGTAPILDDETEEGESVTAETPEELQEVAETTVESISDDLEKLSDIVSGIVDASKDDDDAVAEDADEDDDKNKKDKKDTFKTGDRRVITKAALDAAVAASLRSQIAQVEARDKLANELSHVVGTFDHASMSLQEVANYGLKRVGLRAPKGQERATLAGYLAGKKSAGTQKVYGLDSGRISKDTSPFSKSLVTRGI